MTIPPVPQDGKPPSDPKRNDEYFKQLGIFVSVFAQMESYLFVNLILMAGVSLEVGRATFSGTRAKEAISYIRRIYAVKQLSIEIRNIMEPCFEQITSINEIRNYLMHYGTNFIQGQLKTTNAVRAYLPDKEIAYDISPGLLHDMSSDIMQVLAAIGYCNDVLLQKTPDVVPIEAMKAQQRSWLYRLPAQASKGRKPHENGRRPKRQPQSSPE